MIGCSFEPIKSLEGWEWLRAPTGQWTTYLAGNLFLSRNSTDTLLQVPPWNIYVLTLCLPLVLRVSGGQDTPVPLDNHLLITTFGLWEVWVSVLHPLLASQSK